MKYITDIFYPCLIWTQNYNLFHTHISIIITVNFKLLSFLVQEFSVS